MVYRKELTYYFSTPVAYVVIGLYLLTISLFLWVIPGEWNIIESGYADVTGLFRLSPWLLLLLSSALTMRLFAEERESGTWDVLLSKGVSVSRIVSDKFFAAWTITLLALVPTVVHYFVVYTIAEPAGNVDGGAFAGSMAGLIMLSGTFTAIGLCCSSLTQNQIVNFLFSAVVCFVLYWLILQSRFESVARGVIDLRDMVFFASVALVAVILSIMINSRK
ncbi:MAG: ABC transporter permease subunit [Paludibacteraceae bacterium]|nr:ABC transporter permease subunit [Paludibacteraceae bacterium]